MNASLLKTLLASAVALAISAEVARAADSVKFMIDWLPAGDKAAAYYGVQKGYFKDAGIDVTLQVGHGSSDVVTRLAAGTADAGTGGLSALMQAVATESVKVKAVAPLYTMQPDAIFTTETSGIKSLADLKGKTVATGTFSSSNVIWPLLLEHNNTAPADVKLLKVDPGALAPMLATGKVDATIGWITVAPGFVGPLKEAGRKLVVLQWSNFGLDGYGLSLFASDKFLAERPDVAKRFVVAFEKATEAAIADPAGAAAALKAMVPEVDEAVAKAQWEASIPLMVNPVSKAEGAFKFNPALVKTTWEWVAKAQNIDPAKLDPATIIAPGF
jgi:NitT/TauT family transport system substrate-binding protein